MGSLVCTRLAERRSHLMRLNSRSYAASGRCWNFGRTSLRSKARKSTIATRGGSGTCTALALLPGCQMSSLVPHSLDGWQRHVDVHPLLQMHPAALMLRRTRLPLIGFGAVNPPRATSSARCLPMFRKASYCGWPTQTVHVPHATGQSTENDLLQAPMLA